MQIDRLVHVIVWTVLVFSVRAARADITDQVSENNDSPSEQQASRESRFDYFPYFGVLAGVSLTHFTTNDKEKTLERNLGYPSIAIYALPLQVSLFPKSDTYFFRLRSEFSFARQRVRFEDESLDLGEYQLNSLNTGFLAEFSLKPTSRFPNLRFNFFAGYNYGYLTDAIRVGTDKVFVLDPRVEVPEIDRNNHTLTIGLGVELGYGLIADVRYQLLGNNIGSDNRQNLKDRSITLLLGLRLGRPASVPALSESSTRETETAGTETAGTETETAGTETASPPPTQMDRQKRIRRLEEALADLDEDKDGVELQEYENAKKERENANKTIDDYLKSLQQDSLEATFQSKIKGRDRCSDVAETKNSIWDEDGCPDSISVSKLFVGRKRRIAESEGKLFGVLPHYIETHPDDIVFIAVYSAEKGDAKTLWEYIDKTYEKEWETALKSRNVDKRDAVAPVEFCTPPENVEEQVVVAVYDSQARNGSKWATRCKDVLDQGVRSER